MQALSNNGRVESALDARAQGWNEDGDVDALGAVEGIISGGTTPTKPPRPLLSPESPHHTPRDGRDVDTQPGNWIESEFVHLEGQVCVRAHAGGVRGYAGICAVSLRWIETRIRGHAIICTVYT